jgi:hypothetical protein
MRVSAKRSACAGLAIAPGSHDAKAWMSPNTVSLSCRTYIQGSDPVDVDHHELTLMAA